MIGNFFAQFVLTNPRAYDDHPLAFFQQFINAGNNLFNKSMLVYPEIKFSW